jgi:uncharacterized protein YqiB (DUF1249 family)
METITNTVYHRNYRRIEKILGDMSGIKHQQTYKLKAAGFMDLNIDILQRENNKINIAMAHNYEQNGDLVPDPDMEIEIDLLNKTAEALSFQNTYLYSRVYDYNEKGEKQFVRPKTKKELNSFLETWTKNIIAQGHKITEVKK